MSSHARKAAVMCLALGAGMLFVRQAAAVDEIVVYGTRTAVVMDTAALQIDLPGTVRALRTSVRRALAGEGTFQSPPADVEVASSATVRSRG